MLLSSYLLLWAVPVLWFSAVAGVVALYRRDIHRLWREPVLRYPVLTVESDDWPSGKRPHGVLTMPAGHLAQLVEDLSLLCSTR